MGPSTEVAHRFFPCSVLLNSKEVDWKKFYAKEKSQAKGTAANKSKAREKALQAQQRAQKKKAVN